MNRFTPSKCSIGTAGRPHVAAGPFGNIRGTVLVLVLLFLAGLAIPGGPATACSPDSFVPLQFYDHCRDLAAKVQEAAVARKISHPDAGKLANRLLNAWVDFYLEHGAAPPPVFTQIPVGSWMATMKTMGYGIRRMVDQATGNDDGESALLPLYLLVNPTELGEFGRLMASWTESVETEAGPADNPASFTRWLERCAVSPLASLDERLGDRFPGLQSGIREFLEKIRREWGPVVQADPAARAALGRDLMPRLRRSALNEHSRWRNLLFQ